MGLKHHAVVAIVSEVLYQPVCNPTKCGWKGSVTSDIDMAKFEIEMHYVEVLELRNS
jgi:hypothetical protein